MFTGIILAVGKISQIEQKSGDVRLAIDTGTLSLKGAIESSTNIATVGGKQTQVKQYKLYNTYNLKSVILTQYFRPIVGKKPN
jgi:hypothetical protein